ncbi:MAG: bifunctional D-glycero-beta-D-manno-heptose-7-phosphate kinase/D-glycero-beta-D-manno-heptose 1-phosphate adenylyltransferase HldE [Rikenellaceae bacterium]
MKIKLNRLNQGRVLVVGDLMLDTYHIGSVKRISPEAPVPVVQVKRSYSVLGGAANVARNLIGLGVTPSVVGVVGDDINGNIVREMCKELNIDCALYNSAAPTITKTRIIGNDQQVVRIDFEEDNATLAAEVETELIATIKSQIEKCDVVIISDYGKGFCTNRLCQATIDTATQLNKRVIVDPKGTQWQKYSGASVVTPNLKELSDVAGCEIKNEDLQIESIANTALKQYSLDSLLVTRSEKGMSYVSHNQQIAIPTQAREVFDVSGAGDTVVATLSAALAAGFSMSDSIYLANKAAGVVVGKMGTSPILIEELKREIVNQQQSSDKIVARESLNELMESLRKRNKKVVFTNGCFDILHRGHVTYLEETKSHGDILILGLNSDSSVKRLKGEGRPINDEVSRATVMAALSSVDYVVIFDEDTPLELIKTVRPDILAKGGDYSIEGIVGREYAAETIVIPFVDGFSTTKTILKIAEKE